MFSPTGLLALADLLPVMTAFIGRDLRYRFVNKPLAEWLERPRSEILGQDAAPRCSARRRMPIASR